MGFDAAHVTTQGPPFYHKLPQKDDDTFLDVYQRMVDRIGQLPGVQSAAITGNLPTAHDKITSMFQVSGRNSSEDLVLSFNHVGPGYFRTMGTAILAGREFQREERNRSLCIVNESAAKYLFPNGQAIGQFVKNTSGIAIKFPAEPCQIVGVVEDAKFANLRDVAPRTIYYPITKEAIAVYGNFVFLIRAVHEADAIAAYRKAASEIVPSIPVVRFATLQQQIDDVFGRDTLIATMTSFFGALALLLSAIGLYGLLSSSVTQRTSELGIRLALGARPLTVQWMILKEASGLLADGVVLGGAILYATVRFIQSMLYRISPFDPATLSAAIALLAAVAFVAAFPPLCAPPASIRWSP